MSPTFKLHSFTAESGVRRHLIFAPCALLLAFVFAYAGAAFGAQGAVGGKSRLVTASAARVRSGPSASADEVGRLQLGAVVRELERSEAREKVGAGEDYWYRVSAPGGVEGWVFGALTAPFEEARRVETYRKLADERLKIEESSFADRAELVGFLTRAGSETKGRAEAGEFELMRLLALQRALAAIPIDKQQEAPYKEWLKKYEPQIVYSEPAGQWFVNTSVFWDLQKKYADLPLGERIAWEAAQIPLPGECEGFLPCHLALHTMMEGHYLELYPSGANAGVALGRITESLSEIVKALSSKENPFQVTAADRPELRKTVAQLRGQITRAAHPNRARALAQLDAIARRFR